MTCDQCNRWWPDDLETGFTGPGLCADCQDLDERITAAEVLLDEHPDWDDNAIAAWLEENRAAG